MREVFYFKTFYRNMNILFGSIKKCSIFLILAYIIGWIIIPEKR